MRLAPVLPFVLGCIALSAASCGSSRAPFAGDDGTALSYDPSAPAGAPAMLNQGQVAETGCGTLGHPSDCRGDPEFVNVIPAQQYLNISRATASPRRAVATTVATR